MKPNCQEPVGEGSHCVDLNACCASDILILNGFLLNSCIVKWEKINYLKRSNAFTPNCVGKEEKKKSWRNSNSHMLIFFLKVWDGENWERKYNVLLAIYNIMS